MCGDGRIYPDGALLTDHERVQSVGKATDVVKEAQTPELVIDGAGKLVMPGLIDTHVHLAQALLRSAVPDDVDLLTWLREWVWPLQGAFDAADGRASAELCMLEMLKSGTTCFLESLLHTRYGGDGVAEAVARSGMRGCLAKTVMDVPGYASAANVLPPGMLEGHDEALQEFRRLYSRWHGREDGRLQVWLGPRTPGACSDHLYREVAQLARENETGVTMHLAEVKADIEYFAGRGTTPAKFVHDLGLTGKRRVFAHCVWLGENDQRLFAATGTSVAHCPSSNLKLGSGIAPVAQMLKSGVNVALGCDGGPSNDAYDLLREIRLAALLQKGIVLDARALTLHDAVRLATVNGAIALGLETEVGSLDAGKLADFIVVDLAGAHLAPATNPLSAVVYAGSGQDVQTVVIDGKLVVDGGRCLTLNEEKVVRAAWARAAALVERVGLNWKSRLPN